MATKIITKNSSTTTAIPTAGDLVQGELAVNVTDKRLFTEDSGGAIVELGTNPSTLDVVGAATFSGAVAINSNNFVQTAPTPSYNFIESDTTDENAQFILAGGSFRFRTIDDSGLNPVERMRIDQSTGDVSFYDTAGTTAKLVWDASAEMLTTSGLTVEDATTAVMTLSDTSSANQYSTFSQTGGNLAIESSNNGARGTFKIASADGTDSINRMYVATDGSVSFYEDTGTTAKMVWDASAESLDIGSPYPITGLRGARRLVLNGDGTEGVDFVAYASTNGIVDDAYIGGYLFGNDDNNVTEDHFAGMWANAEGAQGSMTLRFAAGKDNYENDTPQMIIDASGNLLVGKTTTAFGTVGIRLEGPNGKIEATRSNNIVMDLNRLSGDGAIANFSKDGTTVGSIGVASNVLTIFATSSSNCGIGFYSNSTVRPLNNSGAQSDNAIDLGDSGARWDDIYATNGTIQTSDRNEKQDIEALSDAETAVAVACKGLLRKFRWIDSVEEKGDDARIHFGIIAQDLQAAFAAEGLDAGRYAMFTSNTWWETQTEVDAVEAVEFVQAVEAIYNEDNELVSEAVEGVEAVEAKDAYTRTDTFQTLADAPEGATERTRLGVRYPELLAFIIAAI